MSMLDRYRVGANRKVSLADWQPDDDGGLTKEEGQARFEAAHAKFVELAGLLYAESTRSLLVVLQGMDTSGKDTATRAVFAGVSPTGIDATSFKAPSTLERGHDFLWRVHAHAPPVGMIAVFNRSHYEDVLIVRVKELVPEKRWRTRYEHINAFEKLLVDEGTAIVKFCLHISKDYQKERLLKRLNDPAKRWKFNPDDLVERARWDDYQKAYDAVLSKCSTDDAPWYVVPAEKRWYRDLVIVKALVETLEGLDMKYPTPTFDPATIRID